MSLCLKNRLVLGVAVPEKHKAGAQGLPIDAPRTCHTVQNRDGKVTVEEKVFVTPEFLVCEGPSHGVDEEGR